jgi:hypothetical protein
MNSYDGPIPGLYKRYIDECIGVSNLSEKETIKFLEFVGNFHPSIKITYSISSSSVSFLDMTVSLDSSGIHTFVFYKPTDAHSYLVYTSSHPKSCQDSIPFSQLFRFRRLYDSDTDFQHQAKLMLDFFRRRLYPETVLLSAWQRVLPITRSLAVNPTAKPSSDRIMLTLTHHPHNLATLKILKRKLSIPYGSSCFS